MRGMLQRRERVPRGGSAGSLVPGAAPRPRRSGRVKWFLLCLALLCCARLLSSWGDAPGGARGGADAGGSGARAARLLGDAFGGAAAWTHATPRVAGADAGAAAYGSPPPAAAPRAVAPLPPGAPPGLAGAPPPPAFDAACATCAVATMLDFNSHAVQLFKQIDGNANRGLFVRAQRPCGSLSQTLRFALSAALLPALTRAGDRRSPLGRWACTSSSPTGCYRCRRTTWARLWSARWTEALWSSARRRATPLPASAR
jgi:hypothetical protein